MANSLVLNSKKYAIYVRVIAGEGDGPLIWIDASGHIHVGPGDPSPQVAKEIQAGVAQIQAGVEHALRAAGQQGHA